MRFIAIVLLTLLPLCLCQDTALGQRFRGARIANTPSRIFPTSSCPGRQRKFRRLRGRSSTREQGQPGSGALPRSTGQGMVRA